jgi:hypothetical protein
MPTQYLGHVSGPNHLQIHLAAEAAPQRLEQRPHVELAVLRRIKERQPLAVKTVLGLHELGVMHTYIASPVPAGDQGIEFSLLPDLFHHQVPRRSLALDRLQATLSIDLVGFDMTNYLAQLPPSTGANHDVIPGFNLFFVVCRPEMVKFSQGLKTDPDYGCH